MVENPFDPKHFGLLAALGAEPRRNGLLDYITLPTTKPEVSPMARAIAGLLTDEPTPAVPDSPTSFGSGLAGTYGSGLAGMFGSLAPPALTKPSFNALANLASPPPFFAPSPPAPAFGSSPFNALYTPTAKPKPVVPETKRKAFFSFHFDDVMRVNNVRNVWKIDHPDSSSNRSFYDSSLWESRKRVGPEGIKQLIRVGVLRTSTVCVLAGSMTWDRRWVRYEIARAIIDGRGLLTVNINGINHHQTKGPHPRGRNPLAHMGIAKLRPNKHLPAQYFLYEMNLVSDGYGRAIEQWSRYSDYTASVTKPAWLTDPGVNEVTPLSLDTAEHDYEQAHGHRNIGSWIDQAAKQAGR